MVVPNATIHIYIYIYIYIHICLQYATGKSIMSFQDLLRRCYRFSSYIQRVRLLSSFRSQQLTADLYNQACRPHAQRHRSYSDGRLSFCSASRFPPRSLHLEPSKGVFHNSLVSWQSDAQVACTHHFLSPWAQVPGPPLSTLGISPSLFSRRNPAHFCMSVSDSVVLCCFLLFSSDVSRRKGSHDLEQKFSRPAIRAASPVRFWVPWGPEASVNSLLLFKIAMRLVAESVLGPARSVARFGTLFPRPITMHYIKQVSRKQASIHTYIHIETRFTS